MGLARNFKAATDLPNQIALSWQMPQSFNNSIDELIVTKTSTHFPMELFNAAFPNKATDSRPIEIYRAKTITGLNTGTISVSGNVLTDSGATFPTNPSLAGRLIRDANSSVYRIISNTATTVTVDSGITLTNGKYVILPDFPTETRARESYEVDIRTIASIGSITNLVVVENGALVVKTFVEDELANLIFQDGNGNKLVIKSNTEDTIFFYESFTPVINTGMSVLNSFFETVPLPYIDDYKNDVEAAARAGTGLLDDKFYYYTVFTKPEATNVAQATFGQVDSGTPTQDYALSTRDTQFGNLLYELWPEVHRSLDTSEDLEDLMQVFGFQFNELHSLINTYNLQDSDNVLITALLPLSEQSGLPSVGFSIGADTLRRIAKDQISCWRLKGSKEGIAIFIREITTWDITNGDADFSGAIQDTLPNVSALRFFDANLGNTNTRITESEPNFVPGGRFARGLPGIIIPGFFTFREFVITIPNVALFVGTTESYTTNSNLTVMTDNTANYGANNSLVGNYLLPNQEEVNDIFQIVANTATTITVRGLVTNREPGGRYAILSPLNTNRFFILNRLMPFYIPFGTMAAYDFV